MPAPRCKVSNYHTGFDLSSIIDHDAPINWPSAVMRMLQSDPSPTDVEAAGRTPLFRDVRNIGKGDPGGEPLKGYWMRRLIQSLVAECSVWFGSDRKPEDFGIHSFRIGKLNDLLQAGATVFEVSTMGRWVSDAVLRYHRLTLEAATALRAKATQGSLLGQDAAGFVGHAMPRSVIQQGALDAAMASGQETSRAAPQVVSTAKRAAGQPSLDSWFRKRRKNSPF